MKKAIAIVCILLCNFTVYAMEERQSSKKNLSKSKAIKQLKKKKSRSVYKKSMKCFGCAELNEKIDKLSQSLTKLTLYMQQMQSGNEEQWEYLRSKVKKTAEQLVATEKKIKMNSLKSGTILQSLCMREEALLRVSEDFYRQVHGEGSSDAESSISMYSGSSEGIDSEQVFVTEIKELEEQEVTSSFSQKT